VEVDRSDVLWMKVQKHVLAIIAGWFYI